MTSDKRVTSVVSSSTLCVDRVRGQGLVVIQLKMNSNPNAVSIDRSVFSFMRAARHNFIMLKLE